MARPVKGLDPNDAIRGVVANRRHLCRAKQPGKTIKLSTARAPVNGTKVKSLRIHQRVTGFQRWRRAHNALAPGCVRAGEWYSYLPLERLWYARGSLLF